MEGNLGRAVTKVSAVPPDRLVVQAPAILFDSQEELQAAFKSGALDRDFVAVVRFQGPRANGMPELHKLMPPLLVQQEKGYSVTIVTDGRMSGASGEILSAIHVCPEVLDLGPLGRVLAGDMIRVDALNGTLDALVPLEEWNARPSVAIDKEKIEQNLHGLGRDLFGAFRRNVTTAEEGAVPLARALVAGGVRVLEITLRSAVALRAMQEIVAAVPDAIVGAGTVRTVADAIAAQKAGACFAVSPGYTEELGRVCRELGLPLLPGVATAGEVMAANAGGYNFLKLFPATVAGGVPMLKALAGPFPDVLFCPTGGITAETAPQFLALPNVPVCGGSWLTPTDAIREGNWARIAELAKQGGALRTQLRDAVNNATT